MAVPQNPSIRHVRPRSHQGTPLGFAHLSTATVDDRPPGQALAPVQVAWRYQSARRLGRGRRTKAIVSVADRPRVNAGTRLAGCGLPLDA